MNTNTSQTTLCNISICDAIDSRGASVLVWTKPYCRRKDGKWMLYINSGKRHSVAISETIDEKDLTEAQQHLLHEWLKILNEEDSVPFYGNYQSHIGPKNRLAFGIDIYMAQNNLICDHAVPNNSLYIVKDNKLFAL